jgi:hypothetical protein
MTAQILFVRIKVELRGEGVREKRWRVIFFETAKQFIEQPLCGPVATYGQARIEIGKSLRLIEGQGLFEFFDSVHYRLHL